MVIFIFYYYWNFLIIQRKLNKSKGGQKESNYLRIMNNILIKTLLFLKKTLHFNLTLILN